MNKRQQRVTKVLGNMIKLVREDEEYANMFSEGLEPLLDDYLSDDAFGTEGQNDPRGDMRDGEFSMNDVQGVD